VATAGIITSAAAIIVVVTGAFAFTGIITTKAVGLGLAVAVLVDATIIRVLLVPATMRILGDWNWWPGGRKKSVFRAKGEQSRRATRAIATAAVIAFGVFALTGFVTASILGFGLAAIVLVNAALICAVLLPIAVRALGEYHRRPSEGENAFEARPKTHAAPLKGGRPAVDGGSPEDALRREEDTQNAVERAERQEAAGNGHHWGERTQREGHNGAGRESHSARPRPGRAHLDGFRRLGRELREEAKSASGERNGPNPYGDRHGPEHDTREGEARAGAQR
jgi:hypothetical protein